MKKICKFIPLLFISFLSCFSCKPTDYSSHILACIGDSITWGSTPKTGVQLDTPYPVALKNELGFGHVCNYGVGSSTVSAGTGSYAPMVERVTKVSTSVSIIIVWGGVNDYKNGCEIGTIDDEVDTTFYGALNILCNILNTKYSNAFSMLMTPLPAKWEGQRVTDLEEWKDAIIEVGKKYEIPVLDLYTNSSFESEWDKPYSDGVHPSQDYVNNTLVPQIAKFIRTKVKP